MVKLTEFKYRYYENLSRCLRAGYELGEANSKAKELTDAQNRAEIEAKQHAIENEISGLKMYGLSIYKKK